MVCFTHTSHDIYAGYNSRSKASQKRSKGIKQKLKDGVGRKQRSGKDEFKFHVGDDYFSKTF